MHSHYSLRFKTLSLYLGAQIYTEEKNALMTVLDVSNKAVLNSLTITDTNWRPEVIINNHMRVMFCLFTISLSKRVQCKPKRETQTHYNLWSCNRVLYY